MSAWLLGGAVGLLVFTYAGYPALMTLLARWRGRPVVRREDHLPRVAIVVVMHNEAGRVAAKVATCLEQDYPADRLRLIMASDGSTDETAARVRCVDDPRVSLLAFAQRRGKAACLNDAASTCDEDVIVFTDARQPLSAGAVRSLVQNFADPSVGVVSGELEFLAEGASAYGQGVDAYWRYEKHIRRCEAAVHSVPGATGALYAIRREAFRPIDPRTILDDVAIPMRACMDGWRVVFDGRARAFDKPSANPAQERRRKVRTLAGNYQLLALMPALLLPWRNPIFGAFVAHKLLRLAAPWAMVVALFAHGALATEPGLMRALFGVHLAFYAVAGLGLAWPRVARWRPARLAAAFVSLNGYAALGLLEYLTNRQVHLWAGSQAPTPHPGEAR